MTAADLATRVRDRLARLERDRIVDRIWARDPTVWGGDAATPELGDRLGWLDLPATMAAPAGAIADFAEATRGRFDRVVLCGMGGSSLAPEVLWRTFGRHVGCPALTLLDSTHPDAVAAAAPDEQLPRTLFLIASKSGTTIETASFDAWWWERTGGKGAQFVAVTDPGTPLARNAAERGFLRVFESPPDVGGRFSALSPFGLVPAALVGIEPGRLLAAANGEADRLRRPAPENPGARLGALLGESALHGADKLTLLLGRAFTSFGLWVEQLVAESTGKDGKGVLPVVGEDPATLTGTEPDRVFVARSRGTPGGALGGLLGRLTAAGVPCDMTQLDDPYELGAEFLRFEFATAVAAAILGVNPFDQPNVAESKRNTARVLAANPTDQPADDAASLTRWLEGIGPGDYAAVMAYLPPTPTTDTRLAALQREIGARRGVAVTVGYGPRFLHSTGQFHKGGPARGHFLQIVDRPARDLPIPGAGYGFARLIGAQAEGDREALGARGRPVARVEGWDLLETVVGA